MIRKLLRRNHRHGPRLDWVDPYFFQVRPYLHVRLEDNLLIKRPNQTCRLNPSGARLLKELLDGSSIDSLLASLSATQKDEVALFLHAIRKQVDGGGLSPDGGHPAVEVEAFSIPFTSLPVLSELALTYACNLRCRFCYAGCNDASAFQTRKILDESGFKEVIRVIREDAQVPSISFTGGEPTLVPFLPALITHAKSLDMRVNLISNGTRMDENYVRLLLKSGLDSAQISMEAANADEHDRISGSRGSHQKSIQAIGHLKAMGIHVHTNTTLHQQNLASAMAMPRFVRETLGLDRLSMNLVIPTGSVESNNDVMVSYSDSIPVITAIQEECRKVDVEFMWYSPLPLCLFNTVAHGLGNKGCAACDGLLSVNPSGDVIPCASFDRPIGNLLTDGFEKVWQSAFATHCREKRLAYPECLLCSDFAVCQGACPLYWNKVGYDEILPHLPEVANPVHFTS